MSYGQIAHYEVLDEVRRDNVAIYFKARDPALRRLVMLKTLQTNVASQPTMRQRFLREARILAAADHPRIVQLHQVGESQGLAFLAMEWIEGKSLAEMLNGTPWPVARCVRLVIEIAQGVAALHKHGVVHRDVNPSVILVASDDQAKIMSAFWARVADDLPAYGRCGHVAGTPGYMAPEQSPDSQSPVGTASDVYSLGAILYELLIGHLPSENTGVANPWARATAPHASLLRHAAPELPIAVEAILAQCLEYDPEMRFPNAGVLAEALRIVLNS